MEVIELVKKHPVAFGAGGLVLLLLLMRGGGSNSGNEAALSAGLAAQKQAGAVDVQLTSINAGLAAARTSSMADLWKSTIATNAAVKVANGKNDTAMMIAALMSRDTQYQTDAQLQTQMRAIDAQTSIAVTKLATDITMNKDSWNSKLSGLAMTLDQDSYKTDRYFDFQGTQTDKQMNFNSSNTDKLIGLETYKMNLTDKNLPAILASNQAMMQIQGNTSIALAETNGATAKAIAAINQQPANTAANAAADKADDESTQGWISTAATVAAAFFSDRRLKKNIVRIGTHKLGIGIYSYDYVWGESAVGVMADEVRAVMPGAVIETASGFDAVIYSMLD
jgi:hypothetical protein